MNYNYLRYFSVLAQVEHYTVAAARLGISQPSLSSAIHNLENELGVKLFEKSGRNVRLTEQGRYFREKVEAAMEELEGAKRTLQTSREQSPIVLQIGCVSGILSGLVGELIRDYIAEEDRARFRILEDSSENLMDLLRQEKLDMAIVDITDRDRSLHFRKLRQRDFCVAMLPEHELAQQERLTSKLLQPYPLIGCNYGTERSFGEWTVRSPLEENIICQVNTVQAALDLTAAGVGITIIPQECAAKRDDLAYVPLENWHQALYLCILYDRWLPPPVWDFVETVVRSVRRSYGQSGEYNG
ncbi:MAG: LysR family transcriptional regulator [Oscillospiraceae bacterium]|nr:LysR family transcriptional regulator [Oscillospiraceae bacterium]